MKLIKNISGRFFAAWAIFIFILSIFLVFIPLWVTGFYNEPKKTFAFYKISRVWTNFLLLFFGCTLKIKGEENFKKGENYIVISNHNSMMDITMITPFIPGPNKTIAKAEISKVPVFGAMSKRGSVIVDRKSKTSRMESFNKMKDVLKLGFHMAIYPEGTRNKTSQPLKEFHDGAFKLSFETNKPIIPAILFNTKRANPSDKAFFFWPTNLYLDFLPAVYPKDFGDYIQLKEYLFELMKTYYVTHLNHH